MHAAHCLHLRRALHNAPTKRTNHPALAPYAARRYPVESALRAETLLRPLTVDIVGFSRLRPLCPQSIPQFRCGQRPRGGQEDVATASTAKLQGEYADDTQTQPRPCRP